METENLTPRTKSQSWDYFTRVNAVEAKCSICSKIIKTINGNTSGLNYHITECHKIGLTKRPAKRKRTGIAIGQNISSFDDLNMRKPLHGILARMTARDGLPFGSYRKSADLRKCTESRILVEEISESLPKSDSSIKKFVMDYASDCKELTKSLIQKRLGNGEKFSLDCDEWTSIANKRYLNLSLLTSSNEFWNLGLSRIKGRATAEALLNLVRDRTEQFGLKLECHIVGLTTDGASVMKKVHKLSPTIGQLCLAHAIQLAVCDVFYEKQKRHKTKSSKALESSESDGEEADDDAELEMEETVIADDDDEMELDDSENEEQFKMDYEVASARFGNTYVDLAIGKIRKLSTFLKKSPPADEKLQSYVKDKYGTEKPMKIDCKVKWISLFNMLDRYWEIRDCIDHTLVDLSHNIEITDLDKKIIWCVIKVLNPVSVTVKNLCRRESNLLTAREALKILFRVLESQTKENPLAELFLQRLVIRISERWTVYGNVIQYLNTGKYTNDFENFQLPSDLMPAYEYYNPSSIRNVNLGKIFGQKQNSGSPSQLVQSIFDIPDKVTMKNHLFDLVSRLSPAERTGQDDSALVGTSAVEVLPPKRRTLEEIMNACTSSESSSKTPTKNSLYTFIGQQMTTLEKGGGRGRYLEMCFEYLKTIKSSSVESERAFSASRYFCTKIKSRYQDNTLDNLCFLRALFRNSHAFSSS